jgi:hypothetical protein
MPQINHMGYKPEQPVHPLEFEQQDFCNAIAGASDQGATITAAIPSLRMALNVKSKFSLPEI